MSASALCSLFALSMGSASAQNDFQQVVTTTTSGNKAFLDVDGKRLQQSMDSLFKWVDDLETLTSTPADPDTVYNYENTLTVQQGGFQAFSTEGGMMGITDFDLDGMNMPVIVGMAGVNLNGSTGNLQIGMVDVGWNYSDLNLVGGNNPAFSASPEQILEAFFAGDANADPGNVRTFLDSAEVGQYAFSADFGGTIEGDQILWAQDSLVFLGKDILNEASGMIESTSLHNHIQVTGDAGIDANDNLFLNGYGGVNMYSFDKIHSEVSDDGDAPAYLDIAWANNTDPWLYGGPDQNGHIVMNASGGMNLTVDQKAGMEVVSYDGGANMDIYSNSLDIYSVNPDAGTRWASVEMGGGMFGTGFMTLETEGEARLETGGDMRLISGNDMFVNVIDNYQVSSSTIINKAMGSALIFQMDEYDDEDFDDGDGYWHYSDPNDDHWDASMPVIYMESSDDIAIYSENTGGLEICRDCGTVSLFANTGDMNVDAVDGQLNIKAGGMIESTSMHNSVVVTGDAGIQAGDDLFLMADGSVSVTGADDVSLGSASQVFQVVAANDPEESSIELAVNSAAVWEYGAPDANGHIAMNAYGGMNLTVDHYAGIEMAYDEDADVVDMDLYANEFVFHDGPVVAPSVRANYLQVNPTDGSGPPANLTSGMIFLDPFYGLLVYFDGQLYGFDLTPINP